MNNKNPITDGMAQDWQQIPRAYHPRIEQMISRAVQEAFKGDRAINAALSQMAREGTDLCASNEETGKRVIKLMNDLLSEFDDTRMVGCLLMAAATMALHIPPQNEPTPKPN